MRIRRERLARARRNTEPMFDGDAAPELFAALRALRTQLAKAQNLPPYVIFHDKTLHEIAARRPNTRAEFEQISGVGEKKSERYGTVFLKLLAEYEAA